MVSLAVLLAVALPGVARVRANGLAFFKPANGGVVDLVYVGQVKDADGNLLSAVELAVVTDSRNMYEITFDQDGPGHYRSPDVGVLYKEALQEVDPKLITITARKYGYQTVIRRVPLRTKGTLRVDFTMRPGDGDAPLDTSVPTGEEPSSDWLFLVGGAARRRRSLERRRVEQAASRPQSVQPAGQLDRAALSEVALEHFARNSRTRLHDVVGPAGAEAERPAGISCDAEQPPDFRVRCS